MIRRGISVLVAMAGLACGAPPIPPDAASVRNVDSHVASADGVPIHYVVEGSGPTVVLSHCLGCNLHYWDAAAADLARDHRVVRLDLAGHGGSGTSRSTWSVEAFAGDIRAVVDAVRADRFTLVGHSMSGPVALETARQLGERVTGVVPVDSVLDAEARVPAETRAAVLAQVRTHYQEFTDDALAHLMPANADANVVARVRRDALAIDPERAANLLDRLFAYREDLALDALRMPIVEIDSDRRPVALAHDRAHAPQLDARILPGTGHWLMLDQPAAFARALRDVVTAIETGKARRRVGFAPLPA